MSSNLSSEIQRFWGSARQRIKLQTPLHVGGLSGSVCAKTFSDLLSSYKLLVICADEDVAARMHQDLKTLSHQASAADYFPGWEQSPYRAFNPSIKTRIRRLQTVYRIFSGQSRVVVTHPQALAQRCASPEEFFSRLFELKKGDFLSRDELLLKLESAGYTRTDPVEDPGTYSVRGGLVDIFTPSLKRPVRIEFFGDEVESLRLFDPSSQLSEPNQIQQIAIIPVTDYITTEERLAGAKTKIKNYCDEAGIQKKSRDEFMSRFETGIHDPLLEYYFPFFLDGPAKSLFDHLDNEWRTVVFDPMAVNSSYDQFIESMRSQFKKESQEGGVFCSWNELFLGEGDWGRFLKDRTDAEFSEFAIGVPEQKHVSEEEEEASEKHLLDENGRGFLKVIKNIDLKSATSGKTESIDAFYSKASIWQKSAWTRIVIASTTTQAERLKYLLDQHSLQSSIVQEINWNKTDTLQITDGHLSAGFRLPSQKLAIISDAEIFGPKKQVKARKKEESPYAGMGSFLSSLEDLNPQDFVVHHRHGVGRYSGLVKLEVDKIPQDFLLLEYAGNDKLYLPVYRLDQVQKYIGSEGATSAVLDKLGAGHFEKTKAKVKQELQELAHQLLQLYAKRTSRPGISYSPPDEAYREFEARFPYAETPDQQRAIDDVLRDMQSDKIMDRLICGDVGYGKTEVAMRAAYRAVLDGKQVAVLVPTTVLALQHERSFTERFKETGVRIGGISRFKSTKEVRQVLEDLKQGQLDIVIGTHRLLSKDVAFKDLGLMIVDEEQRFGVEHKERLKQFKVNTDVLTLTATPIPRTLQMSLMGMRDISVIGTAPIDRLAVRTYAARFDEEVIRKGIEQELSRGGQVFFLHNRVQSIGAMSDRIQRIIPNARIIVAHGQLDERDLEQRMLDFYNKKGDVLLCSTIIESGLDISSANTIIINRADMFGLSQLYQLRGRVGRSQQRAYCYLLLPEEGDVTEDAKKRLEVIQRFVDLGSGFKVASHDLELRGGGDILGKNQSGHIASVGYEMFMEMLEETVQEIKGEQVDDHFDPEIKIPVAAIIPESYAPDVHQRLGFYKRLSDAQDAQKLHELETEMQDRYGKPPIEVQNLFWLIRLKQTLRTAHVKTLICGKEKVSLDAGAEARLSPQKMMAMIQKHPRDYQLTPDSKIVIRHQFDSAQHLFQKIHDFISAVSD